MTSVLLVEDDEAFAYTVRRGLEAEGHRVLVAVDGTAAIRMLETTDFEVVVTDVILPGGGPDGMEVLRAVRARETGGEVIVMSSHVSVELATQCVREGAFELLRKPLEPLHLSASVRHATEKRALRQKKREYEALEQAEAWYRTLFENAPTPLMVYDPRTLRYLAVNEAAVEAYGYTREEFLQLQVTDIRPEKDVERLHSVLQFRGPKPVRVGIWHHRRKDGSLMDMDVTTQDITIAGRLARLVTCHDVTEKQRTARALADSEANFRAVIEQCPDYIWVVQEGVVVYANPSVVRALGSAQAGELLGRRASDFVPAEDREAVEASVAEGASFNLPREVRLICRDGSTRFVETVGMAVLFNGRPSFLRVGRDLTERKELEARLNVADRMASLGTLAAGVAHEINNPLAYVLANLSFLGEELQRPPKEGALPEIHDALQDAQGGVKRVQAIVQDLKSFSRVEEDRREPVDVHGPLSSAVNLAWNEIRHRARLVKEFASSLPRVEANEGRLGQVFLNLLVNAAQAIPEGAAANHQITLRTGLTAQNEVFIEVGDTGVGMSPEVQRRIFDPFFTTKPQGVGTGLGLSICQGLVTSLGGSLQVQSAPGRGTTFRVQLPALPASTAAGAAGPSLPAAAPVPRRAAVMVVDDDAPVGAAIQRALRKEHDVRVFRSSREALASLAAGERFDLILCDLMMPEMTGLQFYERLSAEAASRTVFITGGVFSPETMKQVEGLPNPCLEKPVDATALRLLVRERVSGPHARSGSAVQLAS